MASPRRNYMAQADIAFSKYIRNRDRTCRIRLDRCEGDRFLQCAHLISRSYKTVRVNPSNAVAACRSCHITMTHKPLEWEAWIIAEFGKPYYDELRRQALSYGRVDWKAEAQHFKALI